MNRLAKAFVLLPALAPLPASASEVLLSAPHSGASLHAGATDMSVHFTEADAGAFEVVATHAPKAAPGEPLRLRMSLAEVDAATFALPDDPETLYALRRDGSAVSVAAAPAGGPAAVASAPNS